jgi:hypothetical protein
MDWDEFQEVAVEVGTLEELLARVQEEIVDADRENVCEGRAG